MKRVFLCFAACITFFGTKSQKIGMTELFQKPGFETFVGYAAAVIEMEPKKDSVQIIVAYAIWAPGGAEIVLFDENDLDPLISYDIKRFKISPLQKTGTISFKRKKRESDKMTMRVGFNIPKYHNFSYEIQEQFVIRTDTLTTTWKNKSLDLF